MPLFPDNHLFFILDFETTGLDPEKDFPIEIGCVIADCELKKVREFETLIKWDGLIEQVGIVTENYEWKKPYRPAAEIHKISPLEYAGKSILASAVASTFLKIANQYAEKKRILLSDNIQFEWQFLKKLMAQTQDRVRIGRNNEKERNWSFTNWPWHYCGWDSSLFLDAVGIGDPPKEIVKHRALADAQLLHEYLQKAYQQVRNWRIIR